MQIKKLSIIMPAYNEERTIHLILDRVKNVDLLDGIEKELIIVNDHSSDDTEGAVKRYQEANPELNIQYHSHEVNKGKGAALHTGISKATGEFLIIQDADLEYDPQEYNDLLAPVLRGEADVVYGSPLLLAYHWESVLDTAVEHDEQPESLRHGDLLQALQHQDGPRPYSERESIWIRT